ncbi:MAG: ABC transporter ATP-binding protein/permease [Clostridiales bacterium]|jgi:ATP-binding cassette subfamily B protein|nr:ABC transporter ATP-binding protein/permease [Clostridiales bacterium]
MIPYFMKRLALSREGAKGLIKACAANILTNLLNMLPVMLLYMLLSELLGGGPVTYWVYLVGIAVFLALLLGANYIQYNAEYLTSYRESGVRRITLAEKLRKLPLSFFGKRDLSDLTTTVMGDCTTLETAFSHWFPKFYGAMVSILLVSVAVCIYDWRMAIAALWVLPVSLAIVYFSKRVQAYYIRRNTQSQLACSDGIQECLEAARDLKSNNAEAAYLAGLNQKIDTIEKAQRVGEFVSALFIVSAQLVLKFGIATTALFGGIFLMNGTLELMTFLSFLMLVSRLYDPLAGILENLAAINVAEVPIGRTREINEYGSQEGGTAFSPEGYDIAFQNVGFSYDGSETVLKDVSFTARQGEVTALIGPSGGGKSTIARLAARFWDIDKGRITVGGKDIQKIDPETLLSAYSIVFQDVTLFDNSILENIRIGRNGATDEEVKRAAEEAMCMEFIDRLPAGFDTVIGENGSKLSGGERQRISIARALLKDAPIVLLDEATASLDAENETKVQAAISRLVKDKTVLLIAHRMRTVEAADYIVCLKDGIVAEQGPPADLKQQNGLYAKNLDLQKRGSILLI